MRRTAPAAEAAAEKGPTFLRNPYLWAFLIGIVSLTAIRPLLRREPPPPPVLWQLPEFSLTATDGRPFGTAELAGGVFVVDFFFTRCVSICPLLTQSLLRLQQAYDEAGIEGVRLVSISIDPEHDTPERLGDYAREHGIDSRRWALLTGSAEEIRRLVETGFRAPLGQAVSPEDGPLDIAHSGKLFLVDRRGAVRGLYDADDAGLDEVFHRSQHLLREAGEGASF